MLFNSFEFILVFLPIVFSGYFLLTRFNQYTGAKLWLLIASFVFYSWFNVSYVFLLATSIAFNFVVAKLIVRATAVSMRKLWLSIGVIINVGLLGYYKYADFFISNINAVSGSDFNLLHIILPVGISFFTFQQIAYLVDTYKNESDNYDLLNYSVFVSFFPQILSGPISHHKEMIAQFKDKALSKLNTGNIARGIFIFNMGLAKKIVIADTFGKVANHGYANSELLGLLDSWITSFSYSVQLYFDFSGYTDMAIGVALLFNIRLPENFWSPHKSVSIQEFYRRWHITLSRFMRNYIYIPLGGNRRGEVGTYFNLCVTFVIGGLWHGASWTFVFWGALNGIGLVVHRLYRNLKINTPDVVAIAITFVFVMIARVFFRASDWSMAMDVLKGMAGLQEGAASFKLLTSYYDAPFWIAGIVLLFGLNSTQIGERFTPNVRYLILLVFMILLNLMFMNSAIKQDFLYFDF